MIASFLRFNLLIIHSYCPRLGLLPNQGYKYTLFSISITIIFLFLS